MMTDQISMMRVLGFSMLLICVLLTASACGKRGDPYRPSEVPVDTSAS